ncbi:hypothetical protein PJP90_001531, partial [Campylobacter coli]|nr:hypothetical protein [Campylobacter coli]
LEKVNHKHSVLQMGLIGVSIKGYPIFAIPKKNKIQFALAKIQASPLAKIEYDRIRWEGMGGKRSKKNKNDRANQIQALKNNQQNNKQNSFLQEVELQKEEAEKVLADMKKKIQELKGINNLSTKQKGNYGEAKMDLYYLKQGYKELV